DRLVLLEEEADRHQLQATPYRRDAPTFENHRRLPGPRPGGAGGPANPAAAFALAIARTRFNAPTDIPFERPSTLPRSFCVRAARSSGLITSNSSETDSTPARGRRCSLTWFSKLERSGQPATVRAIVTAMCPPPPRPCPTLPSAVTGRFSSGWMPWPRAPVICSRVGCSTLRG